MYTENILQYLLQGMALGLPAAATPGPFQTYLINHTLTRGWRRTAPLTFVPLISDIPAVITITFLLNQLPEGFLQIISLIGGIFVLFIAWDLWKQWRSPAASEIHDTVEQQLSEGIKRGLLMNLLSPGLYTFWTLVSGPILVSALQESWISGAVFLLGFYATLIGGFLGIVIIFNQAHRLGSTFVRGLMAVSILVLILFGAILLYRALG